MVAKPSDMLGFLLQLKLLFFGNLIMRRFFILRVKPAFIAILDFFINNFKLVLQIHQQTVLAGDDGI